MKHLLLIAAFFLVIIKVQSQNVGIGTSTPATILDVVSTTKGVLIPRLTTVQMNAIVGPASGLIITNTDSSNRIFIYTGTEWKGLSFTSEASFTDTSLLVHKAGTEIITGNKIFTTDILVNGITIGKGGGDVLRNTVFGLYALLFNTTGNDNIAIANGALGSNTTGNANLAIGTAALYSNIIGSNNTASGYEALYYNTSGSFNTAYGSDAGVYLADGSTENAISDNSIFIGANTRSLANNQTNQIVIGNDAIGDGDNSTVIGSTAILSTKLQGKLKLPAYGTGSNIGTAVYNLATDASGNIIEVVSGGGGGGGDMFLAGSQNVTGVKTFDTTQKFGVYRGHDIMDWRDKSHPTDSTRWYFTNPIGGGIDLNLNTSGGRFILNGDLRLTGAFETTSGLIVSTGGNPVDLFGVNNFKVSTGGTNIDIIKGGINQNTYINGYTSTNPVIINEGTGSNSNANVLIGTSTDNTSDKLQVNGAILSAQYKLSALNIAPASSIAAGTTGEVRITSNYIYVCIATNTWVRSPLSTW